MTARIIFAFSVLIAAILFFSSIKIQLETTRTVSFVTTIVDTLLVYILPIMFFCWVFTAIAVVISKFFLFLFAVGLILFFTSFIPPDIVPWGGFDNHEDYLEYTRSSRRDKFKLYVKYVLKCWCGLVIVGVALLFPIAVAYNTGTIWKFVKDNSTLIN